MGGPYKGTSCTALQTIMAHLHDNLLTKDGKVRHNGMVLKKNEEISPTVERLAVLRWLELIDSRLHKLVARTFAQDLQERSLKDIQPQISSSLPGFVDELKREDS